MPSLLEAGLIEEALFRMIYLIYYFCFWLCCTFVAACRLCLVSETGDLSGVAGAQALPAETLSRSLSFRSEATCSRARAQYCGCTGVSQLGRDSLDQGLNSCPLH